MVARKLDLKGASGLLFLLFLQGCMSSKRISNQIDITESLCIDGLVANIDSAGCSSLYLGERSDLGVITIRCTYAKDKSIWTESRFYVTGHGYTFENTETVRPMCQDGHTIVYVEIKE
jgi:hypothetical protein